MNKTISFFYLFSFCCFGILLFINHFSLSFLNDVPVLLNFTSNPAATKLFTLNYFLLLAGVIVIYIFITVIGINILGSGLSDESIAMIRRLATILVVVSLLSPFYNALFSYCGLFGSILSYVFTMIFVMVQLRGFNEEV